MSPQSLRIAIGGDGSAEMATVKEMLKQLGHVVVGEARTTVQFTALLGSENAELAMVDLAMLNNVAEVREKLVKQSAVPLVVMGTLESKQVEELTKTFEVSNVVGFLAMPFGEVALDATIRLAMAVSSRLRVLEKRLSDFQRSHADRALVEKAKMVLCHRMDLTESEAHRHLQRIASSRNKKMVEVAREIANGVRPQ